MPTLAWACRKTPGKASMARQAWPWHAPPPQESLMRSAFFTVLLCCLSSPAAVVAAEASAGGDAPPRIDKDGWEILFDGKNLDAWNMAPQAVAGPSTPRASCTRPRPAATSAPSRRYCDFVDRSGFQDGRQGKANSGVFIRVHNRNNPVNTGMEIQILDNADYGVPFDAMNANGALYDLVRPAVDANKPIGEWNHLPHHGQRQPDHRGAQRQGDRQGRPEPVDHRQAEPRRQAQQVPSRHRRAAARGLHRPCRTTAATPVWFRNVRLKPLSRPQAAVHRQGADRQGAAPLKH